MNTYYLSYQCKPLPGHENAALYSGMVADVFITVPSEDALKGQVERHLRNQGWEVERTEHAELATSASPHDTRMGDLYREALKDGIAVLFSPYT